MLDIRLKLPRFNCSEAWLFGSKTRLADRATPCVEKIQLPSAPSIEGTFQLSLSSTPHRSAAYEAGNSALTRAWTKLLRDKVVDLSRYEAVVDLRVHSPENWAHAFTNQLPVALLVREKLREAGINNVAVMLPEKISSKVEQLFRICDFDLVRTNQPAYGNICELEIEPWLSIRGIRPDIVRRNLDHDSFRRKFSAEHCLGEKVYVSRKDTRKQTNESDIWSLLEKRGYTRLYLEDCSLEEQVATLAFAKDIIAVHGASLGPLLLRPAVNPEPFTMIEIFSPAHVTNVYRMIAEQIGGRWLGVRGQPWPELLRENADFTHNLADFTTCPDALAAALAEKDSLSAPVGAPTLEPSVHMRRRVTDKVLPSLRATAQHEM